VSKDAIGTDTNTAGAATVPFVAGGLVDGANLTYTGRTNYGPTDQVLYGYIAITPYMDPTNITQDMIQISSPDVQIASFQAYEGGFGQQTPVT